NNRLFINGQGVLAIELDPGATSGGVRVITSSSWSGSKFVYGSGALYRNFVYNTQRLDVQTGQGTLWQTTPSLAATFGDLVATQDALYLFINGDPSSGVSLFIQKYHHPAGPQSDFDVVAASLMGDTSPTHTWDGTYIYSNLGTTLRKANPAISPLAYTDIPLP